jgi:hypothetical protein
VSASVHSAGVVLLGWQQLWFALPHSHWPALQAPVLPAQLCPSPMQRFCQQQLVPLHFWSAQQGWPSPPQGWQVGP